VSGMDEAVPRMTPGNVLDMHARLREAFRRPGPDVVRLMSEHAGVSLHAAEVGDASGSPGSLFAVGRDGSVLCREFARDLFDAVTFQVTEKMAGVVHAAGENGRGVFAGLHTEELPAERGFAWLDAPLARIAPRGTGENAGRGIMIDAVTWAVRTYTLPDGALVPGVQVTGWADLRRPGPWTPPGGGRPARYALLPLLPLLTDVIPLGGTPPSFWGGGPHGLAYWARVLWVYMSAEITAMSRDPVARAYRRRAAGVLRQAEVNVVTLRRARTASDTSGEPREIEWSCCWPVQGHHRHSRLVPGAAPHHATPAAADRGHCAICGGAVSWVHGYIKGPDDKPLRVHDKTIYRLSR
jgi:hypothetical protein